MKDMMSITETEVSKMNKPLYLFVGRSASGKTTIANMLEEKYGYKQVFSYCTRKPRYDGEIGHIFISDAEFDNLGELAAYTEYNGHRYGTTVEQLEECSIYVIDIPGVETLFKKNLDRPIIIIYFNTTVHTRILRMMERHDNESAIISRLLQDEQYDWFDKLDEIVWKQKHLYGTNVCLYEVYADDDIQYVMKRVMFYINGDEEG